MLHKENLFFGRRALKSAAWEMRYAGLEILAKQGDLADIAGIETCLADGFAPVRVKALEALATLLAFESIPAIKNCLFYNDKNDIYGSLDVRLMAKKSLDKLYLHTRSKPVNDLTKSENVENY